MERVKVTTILRGDGMAERRQTLIERMELKLEAFNNRLSAKIRKRQKLFDDMRAEEDFDKSMEYLKEFFNTKGGM